jgi:fucose permease
VSKQVSPRPVLGLLILTFLAFVVLGMAHESLGVAWPSMRAALGRPVSDLGLLIAFSSLGYLLASAGYGWAHRRTGTGALLVLGAALLGIGLVAMALASGWAVVVVASVFLGLGGGLTDTGINAHAALSFDLGSINLLHGAYGVGATIGPLIVTISLTSGFRWRGGYGLVAGLQVLVLAMIWMRRGSWAEGEGALDDEPGSVGRRPQMWTMLALFFLYTGVEVAAGQWAFTLLTEGRGMSPGPAGIWVATYWGGLTAGRLGLGVIGRRLSPSRTLNGSLLVALVGLAVLWWDPAGAGVVGLPIAGLGLAAVFPTLVAVTPTRMGRMRSTSSIGRQLAAASLGAASIPWLLGIVAEAYGLVVLSPGLFIAGVALAVVHVVGSGRS